MYTEGSAPDDRHFSFDEMRLVEELLIQADSKLKERINENLETFIQVVKSSAAVKGVRWDDIVTKFEYQAITAKALISQLDATKIRDEIKRNLAQRIQSRNELDQEALAAVIADIDLSEHVQLSDLDSIVGRHTASAHERIKHVQLLRL